MGASPTFSTTDVGWPRMRGPGLASPFGFACFCMYFYPLWRSPGCFSPVSTTSSVSSSRANDGSDMIRRTPYMHVHSHKISTNTACGFFIEIIDANSIRLKLQSFDLWDRWQHPVFPTCEVELPTASARMPLQFPSAPPAVPRCARPT